MKKTKTIVVTAAILLLAMLFGACADSGFNYNEDLSAYVTIDADKYTGVDIKVGKEPVVDAELIARNIGQRASSAWTFATANKNESYNKATEIPEHALAYVRYYGVTVEDGKPFKSGSNISATEPTALMIGSGTFVEGFEEALLGVKPTDTSYISTKGTAITGNEVVYITAKATYKDADNKTKDYGDYTFTNRRVDLAITAETAGKDPLTVIEADLADLFRAGAKTNGLGKQFTLKRTVNIDGKDYELSIETTVNYIVKDKAISLTFPEDYAEETLKGKAVIFYVTVDGYLPFARVTDKLGDNGGKFTVEEGKDLYTELSKKVKTELEEAYAVNIVANRRNAIWDHLMKEAKVNMQAEQLVTLAAAYYDEALENWKYTYDNGLAYGAIPYDSVYATFEKMMEAQYGENWDTALHEECNEAIAERVLLHYMAATLNVTVTEAEVEAELQTQQEAGYDFSDFEEAVRESLLWDKLTEKLDNQTYITVTEQD